MADAEKRGVDPGGTPDDEVGSAYYSSHDLREMFSRENAERRRQGAKTLRRYLTTKQDKQVMNRMVRIRDEYDVANNDDVIIVWVQQMVEDGNADEVDPKLLDVAAHTTIPRREGQPAQAGEPEQAA